MHTKQKEIARNRMSSLPDIITLSPEFDEKCFIQKPIELQDLV
jgi:hypothetical protein